MFGWFKKTPPSETASEVLKECREISERQLREQLEAEQRHHRAQVEAFKSELPNKLREAARAGSGWLLLRGRHQRQAATEAGYPIDYHHLYGAHIVIRG